MDLNDIIGMIFGREPGVRVPRLDDAGDGNRQRIETPMERALPERGRDATRYRSGQGNMREAAAITGNETVIEAGDVTRNTGQADADGATAPAAQPRAPRTTGADILRDWLHDPETLGRAFIVREVIDPPLALREER